MATRGFSKKSDLKFPDRKMPKPPGAPSPPKPPGSGCGTGSETKKVMDFLDKFLGKG